MPKPVRVVYAITHNATGKVYVGITGNLKTRYQKHINDLRRGAHSVRDLQQDFDRYGEDFTLTVLEELDTWYASDLEHEWMEKLRSRDRRYGYNYRDPTAGKGIKKSVYNAIR